MKPISLFFAVGVVHYLFVLLPLSRVYTFFNFLFSITFQSGVLSSVPPSSFTCLSLISPPTPLECRVLLSSLGPSSLSFLLIYFPLCFLRCLFNMVYVTCFLMFTGQSLSYNKGSKLMYEISMVY